MLFISPPFGNYVNLPNTIPITGSFTLQPRKGLFMQIIKTLRYSFEHGGWVNKIGLRNKGLDWALKNITEVKKRIGTRSIKIPHRMATVTPGTGC